MKSCEVIKNEEVRAQLAFYQSSVSYWIFHDHMHGMSQTASTLGLNHALFCNLHQSLSDTVFLDLGIIE
ncbi:hypothetical protein K1719_008096 [Acacia pycnantha]|nr:hypothetical protein K1719_008096 [Acacia pycnantha]